VGSARPASDLATEIDLIRQIARANEMFPAVAVTQALESALARGERGPLIQGWLSILEDASVATGTIPPPARPSPPPAPSDSRAEPGAMDGADGRLRRGTARPGERSHTVLTAILAIDLPGPSR